MQSLYQWTCSPLKFGDSDFHLIPDLPLTDAVSIAEVGVRFYISEPGVVYIFPVPAMLNCSGTVVKARYCYAFFNDDIEEELTEERQIFTLLILEQNDTEHFKVIATYDVSSTPRNCVRKSFNRLNVQYCCDNLILDLNDQFHIPKPNFAFGMVDAKPLLNFKDGDEKFLVKHYKFEDPMDQVRRVGTVYPPRIVGDLKSDETLRIFQFIIGKIIIGKRGKAFMPWAV